MYKKSSNAQSHLSRTGSFSTRASPTGRNLLGWDTAPERMSGFERYEAAKLHLDSLIEINVKLKSDPNTPSHALADNRASITHAMEQVRKLKVHRKEHRTYADNFLDYIIQAMKERLNPNEWEALVEKARADQKAVAQDATSTSKHVRLEVMEAASAPESSQRRVLRLRAR